jgi:curved DNA-binding protein CbpA
MSTPVFDYYKILGLTKDASSDDGAWIGLVPIAHVDPWTVRRAYKQKVLETHPDKLPPDSTEEEKDAAHEQFSKVCR